MFVGLVLTGVVAGVIGANDKLLTTITESPWIFIGLVVLQLGLVLAISAAINRLSPAVALALFFLYAASVGVLFAFVFELYTTQSIFTTFLVTAGMFGAVGAWGYVTKRDLSTMGTVMVMALVGLILATIVNAFCGQRDALLDHHLRGRRDLRRAHRLRHAEDQGLRRTRARGRCRAARVDPRRARPLPRFHQPLPVPAEDLRAVRRVKPRSRANALFPIIGRRVRD